MESSLYSFWVAPIHIGSLSLRAPWSSDSDRAARNPLPTPPHPATLVPRYSPPNRSSSEGETPQWASCLKCRRATPHSRCVWEAGAMLRGWPDLVWGPQRGQFTPLQNHLTCSQLSRSARTLKMAKGRRKYGNVAPTELSGSCRLVYREAITPHAIITRSLPWQQLSTFKSRKPTGWCIQNFHRPLCLSNTFNNQWNWCSQVLKTATKPCNCEQPLSCTECGNVRLNDKQKNVAISKNIGHNNYDAVLSSSSHFFATFFNMRQRNFERSLTAHANMGNTAHLYVWWPNCKERENGNVHEKKGEKKRWNKVGGWGGEFSPGTFESGRG